MVKKFLIIITCVVVMCGVIGLTPRLEYEVIKGAFANVKPEETGLYDDLAYMDLAFSLASEYRPEDEQRLWVETYFLVYGDEAVEYVAVHYGEFLSDHWRRDYLMDHETFDYDLVNQYQKIFSHDPIPDTGNIADDIEAGVRQISVWLLVGVTTLQNVLRLFVDGLEIAFQVLNALGVVLGLAG